MSNSISSIFSSVILAAGLVGGAFVLNGQFKLDNQSTQSAVSQSQSGVITVKGVAEAEYKATLATWRVGIKAWGKTYSEATDFNKEQIGTLVKFLVVQGFSQDNFDLKPIQVEEYVDAGKANGFYATRYITVSSKELDKIKKALAGIQDIRAVNNTIIFDQPSYYLENLNDVKRELIAKATQNANEQAVEFTKTSNVKVGALKSASEDSFEIKSASPNDDSANINDTSAIDKKVRLAVTVQYSVN
ncbi:hypothetical protein A1D22_07550 [Pasteurellaceae bacterium LFhippo2]|nr:hypothetical protein [Pasteurellaceae bacterium LFhippo2]